MAYSSMTFADNDSSTPVSAANLNNMIQGIDYAKTAIDNTVSNTTLNNKPDSVINKAFNDARAIYNDKGNVAKTYLIYVSPAASGGYVDDLPDVKNGTLKIERSNGSTSYSFVYTTREGVIYTNSSTAAGVIGSWKMVERFINLGTITSTDYNNFAVKVFNAIGNIGVAVKFRAYRDGTGEYCGECYKASSTYGSMTLRLADSNQNVAISIKNGGVSTKSNLARTTTGTINSGSSTIVGADQGTIIFVYRKGYATCIFGIDNAGSVAQFAGGTNVTVTYSSSNATITNSSGAAVVYTVLRA